MISPETQCDIWTLARSELFCDDAPTYLRMPRAVRDNWRHYAGRVRSLCVRNCYFVLISVSRVP